MLGRAVHMDVINARSTPGLQPKIPLSPSERISMPYPLEHELDLVVPNADEQTPNDLLTLDLEGRALVLDFGLFVLINLYCQNEGSDARFSSACGGLIAAGREVVVIGDLNMCAAPIDHCDEHLPSNASTFWEHTARAWIRDWLEPRGPLIDVLRRFWPDRKGMSTCWNTKRISSRPSKAPINYCPVFVDLLDEITTDAGEKLVLQLPRLAVKYWPEFQGKQLLMSNFFTKRGAEALPSQAPTAPPNGMSPLTIGFDALNAQPQPVSEEQQSAPNAPLQVSSSGQPDIEPSSQSSMSPSSTQTSLNHESLRRQRTGTCTAAGGSKPKMLKAGQSKLSSFFAKPTTTTTTTTTARHQQMQAHHPTELSSSIPLPTNTSEIRFPADKDNTPAYSQSQEKKNENEKTGSAASSWSAVFMPKPRPPL
ncbi:hypothetical protein F5888DRAFT_1891406 [Russula emetica]|nr:hypothetical protein F5888DRAFT_1891406 [Russula emetica]